MHIGNHILAFAAVAALLSVACAERVTAQPPQIPQATGEVHYRKLMPQGEGSVQGGLYDPTMEFSPDGRLGVLAYSAVLGGPAWPKFPIGPYIHTHVATSADSGATWNLVANVNESIDGEITLPNGDRMQGVWRYEVPSLVYDESDKATPWKLFAHRYFWSKKKDRMPAFGWITLKTAANPAGPWSPEIGLFRSTRFPPPPYKVQIDANALDASLGDVVAYTEPGAYYRNGTIYLSLTTLGMKGPEKIVLLASRDHGRNWAFRRTLVTSEDAKSLGYRKLDGSAIVEDRGQVYLFVSPEGRKAMHEGVIVVPFSDLDSGQLARDAAGNLAVAKLIPCQPDILFKPGCGQADYHEHSVDGIVMPQANFRDKPQIFQMWMTGVRPRN